MNSGNMLPLVDKLNEYCFNVNMYVRPPDCFVSIDKLTEMAKERLKLYKVVQNIELFPLESMKVQLKNSPLLLLLQPEAAAQLHEVYEARQIDDLSHWILRFAYSKNKSLIKFFIEYELKWFKLRFSHSKDEEKLKFMTENSFVLPLVTDREKNEFGLDDQIYYKIKFIDIPLLVKMRKYRIHKGYQYTPFNEIIFWLLNRLEYNLWNSMMHLMKTMMDDDRMETILSSLTLVTPHHMNYTIPDSVSLEQLDDEAAVNFPLCMKFLHETLRETHHLKYFARLQYGLFLKGIGLPRSQCLEFWKDEFLQDIPEYRFNRKYLYFFKHLYGKVGGQIDYYPLGCAKIIEQTPGVQEIHGCPYKHWDTESIVEKLREYNIANVGINEIIRLKNEERYAEACGKCFECITSCQPDAPIIHPNQYFENSRRILQLRDMEDLFNDKESDTDFV